MTDNLPALTHDGKRSSISAVSPQPRLSPLFRRLLWGVTAPRNTRYYSLFAKEAWRNFRELRKAEVQLRRRPTSRSSATEGPPTPRPPNALHTAFTHLKAVELPLMAPHPRGREPRDS